MMKVARDPCGRHVASVLLVFFFSNMADMLWWEQYHEPFGFLVAGYYLVLIWLVHKYSMSYEPSKVPPNDFSVCIIGAGFSGINMAIKLKQMGK